ncbi:hypothetical protein GE061_012785 [Apolygus lucorum]|uniref:Uncharacterized protein n=1 Tax=Apolygus lucorum TaxID=248454 RepID=A0A8S9XUI6_APOLU|nr:hypothetical protein GE061_012785 [Apolygus lucorum]
MDTDGGQLLPQTSFPASKFSWIFEWDEEKCEATSGGETAGGDKGRRRRARGPVFWSSGKEEEREVERLEPTVGGGSADASVAARRPPGLVFLRVNSLCDQSRRECCAFLNFIAPEARINLFRWRFPRGTCLFRTYGFQQPSQLQEALLNQDYLNNDGMGQQSYVYLETIVEETSDDLRSDSEYSEVAGWPDTDSEAGSVIHIPNTIGQSECNNSGDWSGSERDLAVPKKRRRRLFNNDPGVNDDDDEDDNFLLPPVTSRSSSLLQFEQLEKQCDTVFRASASSEQFVHSPSLPSMTSSFSFDSLETSRWRFSGSPDSLNEASSLSSSCSSSSELVSSDEDNVTRSFSSRSGNESSLKSSLKSHRSFDSLVMHQDKESREGLSGEFSQSLNNTVIISDDSEPAAPARGLYKTVECLTESVYEEIDDKPEPEPEKKQEKVKGQRSAENLSEDSGFGEHIPKMRRASSSGVFTIAEHDDFIEEQDDFEAEHDDSGSSYGSAETTSGAKIDDGGRGWDDVEAKFNPSWQSAPDLLKLGAAQFGESAVAEQNRSVADVQSVTTVTSTTSLVSFTIKDDDEFLIVPENKTFKPEMNSRHPVVSTPNLYSDLDADKEYELVFDPPKSPNSELFRAQSLRNTFSSVSNPNLRKGRSRGSNIQITTSFINLTDSKSSIGGGSGKGVHFSNVVSEVSWRDRDDWSDEVDLDDKEGEEKWRVREERGRKKEEERKSVRDVPASTTGVPPPPAPSRSAFQGGDVDQAVVNGVSMESHKTKSGLGGFFQRFSLRRLSGRDKKKKTKDVVKVATAPPVTAPRADDVVIIPLHPPKSERRPPERLRTPPPPPPRGGSVMSTGSKVGLLETDLDSPESSPSNKKARSLLNLGAPGGRSVLASCPAPADSSAENRAKSMEFLLDKENQYAAKVSHFPYHTTDRKVYMPP